VNFQKKILSMLLISLAVSGSHSKSYAQYRQIRTSSSKTKLYFAEVRYSFSANQKSQMFHNFMQNVETESSFSDHYEVGFVFHQNTLFKKKFHLYEHLFIMSQIGFGGEFGFDFTLHTNKIIAISPLAQMRVGSISTGLREHTMLHHSFGLGLNITFMPAKNLTLLGKYYPKYDVRYGSLEKKLMTFNGKGWEYGFTILLPRDMIRPFKFFGIDFDFSRIPITFTINSIKDSYTNKLIKMKKLTIGFLLN